MTRDIYLVRHGHSRRSGTLLGHSPAGLTRAGAAECEALAGKLMPLEVERIFSSDLARAAETACILARRLGVPVEFDPALREISYGGWDGLTWKKIEALDPEAARRKLEDWATHTPPGGEPFADFTARVREAGARICACPERVIVVVAHLGVNAVLSGNAEFKQAHATAHRIARI